MKRALLLTVYILFFVYASLLLLPKENLYYAFEKEISKNDIIFSNEIIKEHLLSLEIKNMEVYYKKQFVVKTNNLTINHNILMPFLLDIDANGDFGVIKAKVDFIKQNVVIYLKASNFMKTKHKQILGNMKLIKGLYIYELQF